MVEQMKIEDQERRKALKEGRAPPPEASGSQAGYWSYMSRQVQERTERLGIAGDSMDRLEENSSNFANDVGKYVQSQKKKAVLGGKLIVNTGPSVNPLAYLMLTGLSHSTWFEVWILGRAHWPTYVQLFFTPASGWFGQRVKRTNDVIDHISYNCIPPLSPVNISISRSSASE